MLIHRRQPVPTTCKLLILVVVILSGVGLSRPGMTQEQPLSVSPTGPYTTLTEAMAQAEEGATIDVHGGQYTGPLVINKRLKLVGHDWPVIDGNGQGTVVNVRAPGTVFTGFVIRNSGSSLDAENSGIAVEAPHSVIAHNRLEETLFGIYLRQAPASVIRDNVIHSKDMPLPRRGDGIRVWYSNGVQIENNRVERGRDVVLWYSSNLTLRGNRVRAGRYGLHFMYCDDAHIESNHLLHNSVGAFLMYSRRLRLRHNLIAHNRGPSGYGVGLKDMDDAVVEANLFVDNRVGAYVDNSPREIDGTGQFRDNVFAYNTMGLSLLPSVRRNWFVGNSFVDNQEQVHVGGGGRLRDNVWTEGRHGNYWSDYVGYDAQADGIGDVPYRAERLFEDLLDRHPALRLFVYSPAVQAIDFAARALPFVKPQPKLIDTRPLMTPHLPAGLPTLPGRNRQPLFGVSLALLLLVVALAYLPRSASGKPGASPALPASGDRPMIAVQDLTKRFGTVVAVDRVSFVIQPGEAVAFWGPNGAGKTTILRCLLGLIPYRGTVQLAGYEVTLQGKAARRLVGFVPQELHFHDELTVQETMRFYSGLKKIAPTTMASLLDRLELTAHVQKPVRHLSGGLKQRLALAVALLADPPCLLLDEPTANLDTQAREAFLGLLSDLKRGGKTLLFSSHRQEEVLALADRVLLLEQGRLVADAPPSTLRHHAAWQTTLRLQVFPECLDSALTTLVEHGFLVSREGQSLRVRVAPGEKGAPLHVLMRAHIPVHDFGLEADNGEVEAHA